MKLKLFKKKILFFFVLFSTVLLAQEQSLTGVFKANGASITVYNENSNVSTYTSNGNYSIKCKVGDILLFSANHFLSKRIIVTEEMFLEQPLITYPDEEIEPIKSDAYQKALERKEIKEIANISTSKYTYNKSANFQHEKIKNIVVKNEKVNFKYFKTDLFFEVGYNTTNGLQFIQKSNLPALQNIYSQGASLNGEATFLGAETGNIFSYGPKISTLDFNGNQAKSYNNTVLETNLKSENHLFFNVNTNFSFFGFDYRYNITYDIFNTERSKSNNFKLTYKNRKSKIVKWNTFITYNNEINNQPNSNGFQNNVLLNNWVTPATFNNNVGTTLNDGMQRSFAPGVFNNPNWLLNNNRNSDKITTFSANIKNKIKVSEDINIDTQLNYTTSKKTQKFGLISNAVGFENGYASNRFINENNFNGDLNFNFEKNDLKITSEINYEYEDLDYALNEFTGFEAFSYTNATNNSSKNQSLNRNKLNLLNIATYNFEDIGLDVSLGNTSYISSLQNNKWFLPRVNFKLDLEPILDFDFENFFITGSASLNVNDPSLFYNNQSHNSLGITPAESLQYLAINDLFLNSSIALEEKQKYEIGLESRIKLPYNTYSTNIDVSVSYFNTTTKNSVFPILENNEFQLKNTADILNQGINAQLKTRIHLGREFYYSPKITFSANRTKVLKLTDDIEQRSIAGFSTTSKKIIVGESVGVIVGSAYERDVNNTIVIGDNGFPLIADEAKIIGDPIPDFNIGFSNSFNWKGFKLDFVIDAQKGGDVWNGTQNVLNYFGTSQQSANEREITNFVFEGVNQQGEINTVPVDFYNTENSINENRFVRNDFEGVAEDAIVDGSYINLKSVNLSYEIKNKQSKNRKIIRELTVGLYGNNVFTWSKYKGATPYNGLYDNNYGAGLNFFNTPLISEVGFKIHIKI